MRVALEMRGITRLFPGVRALDHVDFSVRRGEIHSLIGQNGAGKSTLMNILSGVYSANEGEILIEGQPVVLRSPQEALRLGIGTVYQELSLLPRLSVADNIFLGRENPRGFVIDERQLIARAREVLAAVGMGGIDVRAPAGQLSLAQQQLVEIARVLSYQPRILILDEPTAPLVQRDSERLFAILDGLKQQGIAIIFISHRFKEILEHCDRGTILRNGKVVKTIALKGVSEEELAETMIGQQLDRFYLEDRGPVKAAEEVLRVENLAVGEKVTGVSFSLGRGEIVGITGLLGAGQNELARALFGIEPQVSGLIRRAGQRVRINSPAAAIALGICLLTENRKREGLFMEMSLRENVTLPSLSQFRRAVFLDQSAERRTAGSFIKKLNIVARSQSARVRTMSGGNQQKAILARWLLRNLDILILIEPTRGVDVGAKAEIYHDLDRLAREGKSIVVVSPEIAEIQGISDRILVMYNGRLLREFSRSEANEEALLAAIQGGG